MLVFAVRAACTGGGRKNTMRTCLLSLSLLSLSHILTAASYLLSPLPTSDTPPISHVRFVSANPGGWFRSQVTNLNDAD